MTRTGHQSLPDLLELRLLTPPIVGQFEYLLQRGGLFFDIVLCQSKPILIPRKRVGATDSYEQSRLADNFLARLGKIERSCTPLQSEVAFQLDPEPVQCRWRYSDP
jgi:hypothetical protein